MEAKVDTTDTHRKGANTGEGTTLWHRYILIIYSKGGIEKELDIISIFPNIYISNCVWFFF